MLDPSAADNLQLTITDQLHDLMASHVVLDEHPAPEETGFGVRESFSGIVLELASNRIQNVLDAIFRDALIS